MKRRRIGIFGGSFNPVHNGHISLSKAIVASGEVEEVWLTLSPLNPFKRSKLLADDADRITMLRLAVEGISGLDVCDIELSLPRPSYTINTLTCLSELHPDCSFCLIVGADNYAVFDKWFEHQRIIDDYGLIVYPREGYEITVNEKKVTLVDAPLFNVSSTQIRQLTAEGSDISGLVPEPVAKYISEHKLYKNGR